MNEDLLNVMGNFVETELDYIENCEKEKLELEQQNTELKEDIKNLINIINNNCKELDTTEKEFESLKRWNNERERII